MRLRRRGLTIAQSAGPGKLDETHLMKITRVRAACRRRGVQSVSELVMTAIWGGVEMALRDLPGKAWNQPVYQLLGGAVRKDIAFTEYFAYRLSEDGKVGETSAEAVADYCARMQQEHGSTMYKGMVSDADPVAAIAMVSAAISLCFSHLSSRGKFERPVAAISWQTSVYENDISRQVFFDAAWLLCKLK